VISQNTRVSRKFFRPLGGSVESHNGYYKEGGLPSPLPVVMVVAKGVLVIVELVLGLHHRDSYLLGSQLDGQISKGLN
jgi:hypothetical protein